MNKYIKLTNLSQEDIDNLIPILESYQFESYDSAEELVLKERAESAFNNNIKPDIDKEKIEYVKTNILYKIIDDVINSGATNAKYYIEHNTRILFDAFASKEEYKEILDVYNPINKIE